MQRIVSLLKDNCCIFIGAGIPNALGFPLWNKLAQDLIEYVWEIKDQLEPNSFTYSLKQELEDWVHKGKPITAVTYCKDLLRNIGKEKEYQSKITEWLHDQNKYDGARTNPVYMQVGKLVKQALVLQTNLDKSVELYCKLPAHINNDLPQTIAIPCLVYLHGVVTEPLSWIMTRDEYDSYYQQNSDFVSFIQKVFRDYNVLFLGYSLSDKEILDQIAKVKGSGKQHVLVLEDIERNRTANQVWENDLKHYEISVVRYSIDQEGYKAFSTFLEQITSLMDPPVQVAKVEDDGSRLDG